MSTATKKIEVLSELEHVLLRPQIYVSSVEETDESIHFLGEDITIKSKTIPISVGMYKMLWEIFDNSIDEIKRIKLKSKNKKFIIDVRLDKTKNSIEIKDNGDGFYEATKMNPKSKMTNIETAFCFLRSGSNFSNDKIDEALIGTNGVGASLVNMLSSSFIVESTNKNSHFKQSWSDFKANGKPQIKSGRFTSTGTSVTFIPRVSAKLHDGKNHTLFGDSKYDESIIWSQLSFRKKCLMISPDFNDVEINFYLTDENGEKLVNLADMIFEENSHLITNKDFLLNITPKIDNTTSNYMMVNSTPCMGSPVVYLQELLNEQIFKDQKALAKPDKISNYYSLSLFMNLKPELVKFGDQNKTKYALPKAKISPYIDECLKKKMKEFTESECYQKILEEIDKNENDKEKRAIDREKGKNKKISKKYLAASKTKDFLFLVEGDSASGSISQCRDSKSHGIYQLRGKVKNCSKLLDLRTNSEIMDLISILDLKFDSTDTSYKNIVIATDFDPDGIGHIATLLINFFYRWFPKVITSGKLSILKIPLASYGNKGNIKYFYNLDEFNKYSSDSKNSLINKRYLKGLGALDLEMGDWDSVMKDMNLMKINATSESMKLLDMAFNKKDADARKTWLNEVNE